MGLGSSLSGIAGKTAFGRKCYLRAQDRTETKNQIKNINVNLVLLGPVFRARHSSVCGPWTWGCFSVSGCSFAELLPLR